MNEKELEVLTKFRERVNMVNRLWSEAKLPKFSEFSKIKEEIIDSVASESEVKNRIKSLREMYLEATSQTNNDPDKEVDFHEHYRVMSEDKSTLTESDQESLQVMMVGGGNTLTEADYADFSRSMSEGGGGNDKDLTEADYRELHKMMG